MTLFYTTQVTGQTRNLTGRIIDYDFQSHVYAKVFSVDTVEIGMSDTTGNFNVTIPSDTKTIIIADVGMEWKRLYLTDTCNVLEIILLPEWTYDFKTLKKVDKLRKQVFEKLPRLHKSAFERGIFTRDKACYVDNFISIRGK